MLKIIPNKKDIGAEIVCDLKKLSKVDFRKIKSIKTAVLWKKKDSTFEPDYCAQKLNNNPWIVQPFEHYEEIRVEDLIKKHQGS